MSCWLDKLFNSHEYHKVTDLWERGEWLMLIDFIFVVQQIWITKQNRVLLNHHTNYPLTYLYFQFTSLCDTHKAVFDQNCMSVCMQVYCMLLPLGIRTYLCHRFLLSQWHGPAVNKVKHTLTSLRIVLFVYWNGPEGKKMLIISVLCFHSYSLSRWVEQDWMQWFQLFMLVLTFRSCSWSNVKSLTGTSISSRDVLSFFCQDDGRNYIV